MSKRGKKKDEVEAVTSEESVTENESKSSSGGMLSNRKLLYVVVIIAIVALAAWRLGTLTIPDTGSGDSGTGLSGSVVQAGAAGDVGGDAVGARVVAFLQSRLEVSYPGITVELVDTIDYADVPGTYEVSVEITFQDQPQIVPYYVTKDGNFMFANVMDLNEPMPEAPPTQQPTDTGGIQSNQPQNAAIETFLDSGEDICSIDDKPIIRMYASSSCGYCKWNRPMYEKVVKEYVDDGKIVAYLWEDGKNILSEDQEPIPASEEALRQQYGFSGVPAFIFGCKYYRSGAPFSRAENGEVLEEAELRLVIEDLIAA